MSPGPLVMEEKNLYKLAQALDMSEDLTSHIA